MPLPMPPMPVPATEPQKSMPLPMPPMPVPATEPQKPMPPPPHMPMPPMPPMPSMPGMPPMPPMPPSSSEPPPPPPPLFSSSWYQPFSSFLVSFSATVFLPVFFVNFAPSISSLRPFNERLLFLGGVPTPSMVSTASFSPDVTEILSSGTSSRPGSST